MHSFFVHIWRKAASGRLAWSVVRFCLLLALGCAVAQAQQKPNTDAASDRHDVRYGEIASSVRSAAKPQQSYALYLPTNYSPERSWPILYVFDPAARGSRPLELMKDAAEKYGYLLAGSNNSRNGSWAVEQEAAQEMWADTHAWLAIDEHRVYFAGFSGGARVAAQLAQSCKCAQGVFLNGAGFGSATPPTQKLPFSVLSITGMGDFNYGELLELDGQLETLGSRHFLRRFDGDHAWAPADVWLDALAWTALLEMKDGRRNPDESFVATEFARFFERTRKREEAGELSFALAEYRAIAATLDGLADTTALRDRITGLEKNRAARTGAKQEKSEIERQRTLERDVFRITDALQASGGDEDSLRTEARTRIRGLRQDLLSEKRPERRRVLERTLGGLFIGFQENGRQLMESKQYRTAEAYFELAAEARPNSSWPHTSLAQCHALMGDKKGAVRDLRRALENGLSVQDMTELVKSTPKLAALMDTPEYQKLIPEKK